MKMRTLRTIALVWAAVAFVSGLLAQTSKPVRTQSGLVQGTLEDGVTVYKDIPFAAPPLGDLRWRAPQPAVAWTGVRLSLIHIYPIEMESASAWPSE